MKKSLILSLTLIILLSIGLFSCSRQIGDWDDNIHLSTKKAVFNASGDSIVIKTVGIWWSITDISVDRERYNEFPGVNVRNDSYTIKQDCFIVERHDKNTLFIKVEANPTNVKRIITVGFEAGDYFDRVTITQNPK